MNAIAIADEIEIFFGEISAAEARVYVRVAMRDELAGVTIHGQVRGPRSRYARTLTASVTLRALPAGDALLAQAIVPDPCCWTPAAPYLYDVEVELHRDGKIVATTTRELGLRPLGAAGGKLRLEGHNFVLRAAHGNTIAVDLLSAWHESDTALCLGNPDDDLCAAASATGVLLVVEISAARDDFERELRRLSRHAAVGMIVVTDSEQARISATDLRNLARNVVLARPINDEHATGERADWAHALIAAANDIDALPGLIRAARRSGLCIIAQHHEAPVASSSAGRARCDQLQRELAARHLESPLGDIAGYIV